MIFLKEQKRFLNVETADKTYFWIYFLCFLLLGFLNINSPLVLFITLLCNINKLFIMEIELNHNSKLLLMKITQSSENIL